MKYLQWRTKLISLLNHGVLKMVVILSNIADIIAQNVGGRIYSRLPHRVATHMFARKLAERTVSSRVYHQSFGTVIGDVLFVIQRHRLVPALAPIRVSCG